MAKPDAAQSIEIFEQSKQLAEAENRLWQIVEERKFGEVPEVEKFVVAIDSYFADAKIDKAPKNIDDLPFFHGEKWEKFVAAHTKTMSEEEKEAFEAGLKEYAEQHVMIAKQTQALDKAAGNSELSAAIIGTVDNCYDEKDKNAPHGKGFSAGHIAMQTLDELSPETMKKVVINRIEKATHGERDEENDRTNGVVSSEEAAKLAIILKGAMSAILQAKAKEEHGAALSKKEVVELARARATLAQFDLDGDGFNARDIETLASAMSNTPDKRALKNLAKGVGSHNFQVENIEEQPGRLPKPAAGAKAADKHAEMGA